MKTKNIAFKIIFVRKNIAELFLFVFFTLDFFGVHQKVTYILQEKEEEEDDDDNDEQKEENVSWYLL